MMSNYGFDKDDGFDADVSVVGSGSMESAAADRLSERGQKVLGFEQFHRGHDNGSYHGGSRIIRMSYFEHPDYVPLLRRAFELWDELEEDSQQRGWEQLVHYTGGLYAGLPVAPRLRDHESLRWSMGLTTNYFLPTTFALVFPTLR